MRTLSFFFSNPEKELSDVAKKKFLRIEIQRELKRRKRNVEELAFFPGTMSF